MPKPTSIWLQFDGDAAPGHEDEGVTWCEDPINDTDVEYLLATPERKIARELLVTINEYRMGIQHPDEYLDRLITMATEGDSDGEVTRPAR